MFVWAIRSAEVRKPRRIMTRAGLKAEAAVARSAMMVTTDLAIMIFYEATRGVPVRVLLPTPRPKGAGARAHVHVQGRG